VCEELCKLAHDFTAQWSAAGEDPTLEDLANLLADVHHRFQWIHPFLDTNGRTGRVLGYFILWSAFGLAGTSLEASPVIVYFPDERNEKEYYEGLVEADLHRPDRLGVYYAGRLERALTPVFTVH
jgi:Fic family protein